MCTLGYSPICQNKSQQGRLSSLTKHHLYPPSLQTGQSTPVAATFWEVKAAGYSTCKPSLGLYGLLMSCQESQEHFRKKEIHVNAIYFKNLNTLVTYGNFSLQFSLAIRGKFFFFLVLFIIHTTKGRNMEIIPKNE